MARLPENSLYLGKGEPVGSNATQVWKVRGILEPLSREIGTPDDAHRMLALTGRQNVNF